MTIDTTHGAHGSPQFPRVGGATSTREEMDEAIRVLQDHKDAWVRVSPRERVALIETLIADFSALAPRWVEVAGHAKGFSSGSPLAGEEWSAGALPVLRNLTQLKRSLQDIANGRKPRIPGKVRMRKNGQVVAAVFPQTMYDRIFFPGVRAEVWMEPEVTKETVVLMQAGIYSNGQHEGKVALVLGAGNVASIGPMDILYKLFVEDQVVLFKANPVNAYIGPMLEEAFRVLIEAGYLRMVYGGVAEGEYLCNAPGIDEIHITGSDKTFDAIVFGTGAAGAARKAAHQPLLQKRITGELGNVSPVIVVPGPWSTSDRAYQAQHVVSMMTNNAGFNCNATRVLIQHAEWAQRKHLLRHIRKVLTHVPMRKAYYPGAQQRAQAFVDAHPDAELFGKASEGRLPWTLISGVDPEKTDDICFTTEAFCGLFAETELSAASTVEYIERAVDLCNNTLWGSLNATIIVHPESLKDRQIAAAVKQAIADLRYGAIGVNYWAGIIFAIGTTTWGAFPGHQIYDIQSGNGVVHNTLMFSHPQKSVLYAPFRSIPIPPWFVTRGNSALKIFPNLVEFEAEPSLWKALGIVRDAILG